MAQNSKKNNISELSFEEALAKLTQIVAKIEEGKIPLQDSLSQYEQGMGLIKQCRQILQQAEKRIEKISEQDLQQDNEDIPF